MKIYLYDFCTYLVLGTVLGIVLMLIDQLKNNLINRKKKVHEFADEAKMPADADKKILGYNSDQTSSSNFVSGSQDVDDSTSGTNYTVCEDADDSIISERLQKAEDQLNHINYAEEDTPDANEPDANN